MNKQARNLLVSILRNPFTWPGGYERILVTADGALLCHECCKSEASSIISDCRNNYNTGWLPAATTYEAVSAEQSREVSEDLVSYCDHCNMEFGELG